jgi:ubiquinone/menaquinone biosynthesis C-methylase UbiE
MSAPDGVQAEFAAALDVVCETPCDVSPGEPSPQGYHGDLLGPPSSRAPAARKMIRFYVDLFALADREPKGATVVEAGSGFGLGLAAIAALGGHAKGVEFVPWMAAFAARWQAALPPELGNRIDVQQGDANHLPFEDQTVDVMLCLEAISHYRRYDGFLEEAHRVLRPGGVLIVSDGNNALNPRIRRHTHRLWASHEVDPRPELARGERVDDHPWWLVERRKEIVLETEPDLDEDEAYRVALGTAGMVRTDVAKATRRYVADGIAPTATYQAGTLTVHPGHEMVLERLFDPFALAREIESRGFDVRVRGYWGGASERRVLRAANSVLAAFPPRLTMPTARAFRVVAVRR